MREDHALLLIRTADVWAFPLYPGGAPDPGSTPQTLQRGSRACFAGWPALGLLRYFRHVDVRRAFGRRLYFCRQLVFYRPDGLAGAAGDGSWHHGGLRLDE